MILQDARRPSSFWEYVVARETPVTDGRQRALPAWLLHAKEAERRPCIASKTLCREVPLHVRGIAWRLRSRRRPRRRLLRPRVFLRRILDPLWAWPEEECPWQLSLTTDSDIPGGTCQNLAG